MDKNGDSGYKDTIEEFHDTVSEDDNRSKRRGEELDEFKRQLTIKREQRKEILLRHRTEKKELEKSLENETRAKLELVEKNKLLRELLIQNNIDIPEELQASKENSDVLNALLQMKEEVEKLKFNNNKLRCELAKSNNALQDAYSDIAGLSAQNTESIKQINSLKEVINVSKTMINLREQQLNDLKKKLHEIEQSLADRETKMLSADLRQEYERQLQNIRTLRGLYEERARLAEVTRQALQRELEEQKEINQIEIKKRNELNAKVVELETYVSTLEESIEDKNNQIVSYQNETGGLKAEMDVVNKLFSQVLLGYKNKQDLDKLIIRLEENHGILTQMAGQDNGSETSSALPKLLLQLVSQVEDTEETNSTIMSNEDMKESEDENKQARKTATENSGNATVEEIVQNLPKVWRVLMELLSHQAVPDVNNTAKVTTCYKSVDTKSGPVLVPSVSQTYIRLKDLIIEKLTLIKEVNRMKQLNGHLETRLQEQERRLCLVTTELSKTWHVVGRLRRHHHQLHTHEKILKYELQQKRKLLNELKEELQYCREKWEQAREKNSQSEKDWKKLRAEFSSRKLKSTSTSINNSAESGYSDERPSDESSESNDESKYIKESPVRCKKKVKKSFNTVIDSSAECNLAAEREDPASDMLDVAELPLDNQDPEPLETSASCNNEHLNTYEQDYEETEDEVGDIGNDSCLEEYSIVEPFEDNSESCKQLTDTQGAIDPLTILSSIKEQNEMLARKDKKLETLEKDSNLLLKKTQTVSKLGDQINNTLDHLINRPSSSKHNNEIYSIQLKGPEKTESNSYIEINQTSHRDDNATASNYLDQNRSIQNTSLTDGENLPLQNKNEATKTPLPSNNSSTSIQPSLDFNTIMENIKRQNEHLTLKDQRLQNLESACSDVLNSITSTLNTGEQISNKLATLHSKYHKSRDCMPQPSGSVMDVVKSNLETANVQPDLSTSNDLKHEAIFAARDLRLKRLEEQTKSLVNKVNKTATKGVKIHYKLEELHNIYGSENSRASTPSEDNEDSSQSSTSEKEND
ncbi:unnamed protein product [Parnassius apollo]|uniref:(apollo) hypothetical protein n=1 Tax=Parnassius apollo TaxID=110799 RepID=A0A8S3W857_PARAO|nr:unnamed protein product [Parnassius apollo]